MKRRWIKESSKSGKSLDGLPFEISLDSNSDVAKFMRSQDKELVNQFNADVRDWVKSVSAKLKSNVGSLIKDDVGLSDSIKPRVYYDNRYVREANRIGFRFNREGIYVHHGAGRGQGGYKGGSKWTDKYGNLKTTDTESFGKMGSGNRRPVDWFNPIIEQELAALADIVSRYSADMVVDATRIFIRD